VSYARRHRPGFVLFDFTGLWAGRHPLFRQLADDRDDVAYKLATREIALNRIAWTSCARRAKSTALLKPRILFAGIQPFPGNLNDLCFVSSYPPRLLSRLTLQVQPEL
jgi:hypothetical protein